MTDVAEHRSPEASRLLASAPRLILWLAGVLAAQLLLALLLAVAGPDRSRPPSGAPLVAFDPATIDALAIEAPASAEDAGDALDTARLRRTDAGWVLPGLSDFPADQEQVAALLEALAGLEAGWAVAKTGPARQRFEVAESRFQRRITLAQGERTLGTLFLGTSPVFRQIHARAAGEDAIHVVPFAAYDAPADDGDWMDRDALNVPVIDIAAIAFPEFTLSRPANTPAGAQDTPETNALTLTDLAEGETVDEAAVRRLVNAVARPRFETVVGRLADAAPAADAALITITVTLTDGSERRYALAAGTAEETADAAEGDDAADDAPQAPTLFTSSASDFVFRLESFAAESLLGARRADLIAAPEEDADTAVPAGERL